MVEKFGIIKSIFIYKKVKLFVDKVKKRIKNYKTKEKVVEEIIKTEETYI